MRTRVKFCGCTDLHDVMLAVQTGADAVGMIFAPSTRRITQSAAKHIASEIPAFITPVGVFVEPSRDDISRARDIFPDLVVQLHGEEPPEFVSSIDGRIIKTVHVSPQESDEAGLERKCNAHPRAIVLFDTAVDGARGGTGTAFPWRLVGSLARRRQIIVGGGLNPENVAACIRAVRPFGVDVRSGVETSARKDAQKMRAFVQAVKEVDAS